MGVRGRALENWRERSAKVSVLGSVFSFCLRFAPRTFERYGDEGFVDADEGDEEEGFLQVRRACGTPRLGGLALFDSKWPIRGSNIPKHTRTSEYTF